MTLTDYVTRCALGKEIIVIYEVIEFLRELKSQGANLNRLTTLANMGRITCVNLTETMTQYEKVLERLKSILERIERRK